MRAGDELLGAVFNKDHCYAIPIFQRPYVWDEEENWIPLWDDIRQAAESAENQSGDESDVTVQEYFLGALVTQHRNPVPRRTPTSVVIDGQQRMTTFQVFLAAARRVAHECGAMHATDSFAALVRNRVSVDSEHPEDRFKIVPLANDSEAFRWAVREPHEADIPPNSSHKLVRASRWFEDAVRDWVKESGSAADRLSYLHFAVENRIKVVSIFLDTKDDPQVIFEALNHRGVRLDAADLVKNTLFQLLSRQGDGQLERELLHDHWSVLDSDYWREEVTTGRIKRVRVDILLAYWLSAQRGEESSVEHLFENFKRWISTSHARAAQVIRDIRVYADTMDRLQQLPMSSAVAQAIDRLETTNTTTPWPLILFLHATFDIPDDQAETGTLAIDSFLMRRAICRLTTKDYNRLFGTLLGKIKAGEARFAGDVVVEGLASQTADSRSWPTDAAFVVGLMNRNLYLDLVRARLRTLLVGLENHLITRRAEPTLPHKAASKSLTIEHVMPISWEENWPLPSDALDEDIERRNASIHRLGNLTLVTQSLNSTLSNQAWDAKRHTLQTHSLARLTTASILTYPDGVEGFTQDEWVTTWNEIRIHHRESALIKCALEAWPRPEGTESDRLKLDEVFAAETHPAVAPRRPQASDLARGDLLPLIQRRLIAPQDQLWHRRVRSDETFRATVTDSGGLHTTAGYFRAPSTALSKLTGVSRNGWTDWTHERTGMTLDELRLRLDSASDGGSNPP